MTLEEITELAKEAGFKTYDGHLIAHYENIILYVGEELEKFAELVAAHERERCAKVCDAVTEKEATEIASSSAYGGKMYTKEEFEQLKATLSAGECAAAIRKLNKDDAK